MSEPTDDQDDPANILLTTREAADAVHVSLETIRDWARRGLIEPLDRVRGRPRYRKLDVLVAERDTRRTARELQIENEAQKWAESQST